MSMQPLRKSDLRQFFAGISARMESVATPSAPGAPRLPVGHSGLNRFFAAADHRIELQRRLDKRRASGFNVFRLIEPDENKLSDILAGLLDPTGDHGQGDLFLRLLFQQLGHGSDPGHTKGATVRREAPTHGIHKYRRRMDVFVEAGVLLAIENKIDALEQSDQIKDYLEHLRYCTKRNRKDVLLVFLTPNGRRPKSIDRGACDEAEACGALRCWSYQVELREWLAACRQQCKAPRIQDFLADFMDYIESHLKRKPETDNEEETDED